MTKQHVVILGAGPAGLTAGYELTKNNIPVTVLERDDVVGGIARTEFFKGYGYDIGGHRFYTKMSQVQELWHEVLTHDFIRVPRLSRIHYNGKFFYYPLRLMNVLSMLGVMQSIWIFLSYVRARLFPLVPEESFEDYVSNRFGRRLYRIFFMTYTEKVWGIPCTEIRAEWAAQRIRGLSFTSALKSAIFQNGSGIKSLIEEFEYPLRGPGMMWETFAARIRERGSCVCLNSPVVRVNRDGMRITDIVYLRDGVEQTVSGTHFISTLALRDLINAIQPPPPPDVVHAANSLGYRDFLTVILILNVPELFPDNWIYIHTPDVHVGRIQNFKNWSQAMLPDQNTTSLGMEYFVTEGDEMWNMPDDRLIELAKREIQQIGIARADQVLDGTVKRMQKAYPVYDSTYHEHLGIVRGYLDAFENLQTVGRNGMHKYNNQDHSMMTALLAARNIMGESHNVWQVNTDMEYQEEMSIHTPRPRKRDRLMQFINALQAVPNPQAKKNATHFAWRSYFPLPTCLYLWHPTTWSFTIPVACMWAYTIVGPTNRNPRFTKSLLIFSLNSDLGGISFSDFHSFRIGLFPTNPQIYLSKLPNSFCTFKNAFAFSIVARIFCRLRIIPASCINPSTFFSSYFATFFGSKLSNALRKFSRFRKIVIQLSPACAPSSVKNSNNVRSSCTGTPHSSS
jgi:protoporphyrinogen oxidase